MSFGYQILGFGSGGRNYQVRYLVLAGGAGGVSTGGGSGYQGGGGGAGGYRNSFASENSGRASSTETPAVVQEGAVYTITVGAGGEDQQMEIQVLTMEQIVYSLVLAFQLLL